MQDWLGRVDWARRSADLGPLVRQRDPSTRDDIIAFSTPLPFESPLANLWSRLKPHPAILAPAGMGSAGELMLRYAAIDWSHTPVALDTHDAMIRVARWGVEITHAYEFIARLGARDRALLTNPRVFIDLTDHVRIAFSPSTPAHLPPDLLETWPGTSDAGLAFVVGNALCELVDFSAGIPDHPLEAIVRRCVARDRAQRFSTLRDVRNAFLQLTGYGTIAERGFSYAWSETEQGIGHLQADLPAEALHHFTRALCAAPHALARLGKAEVLRRHPELARGHALRTRHWADVAPIVAAHQAARDFAGAVCLLRVTRRTGDAREPVLLALARCFTETGATGEALETIAELLTESPDHVEARGLRALSLLRTNYTADALAACDAWLAVAPDDGAAHHARGKALLALGRPAEARASFDRASQLAPGLVAAAMLRTNLDRQARDLRRDVGLEAHRQLEVPAHLPELVPILAQGRILDAIVWLTDRYDDPAARKLLATCHEYAGDLEAALVVYEHLADPQGMARCLIELGRAEEALALLDHEATELRADALDRLGRTEEAAQVRQHIAWER